MTQSIHGSYYDNHDNQLPVHLSVGAVLVDSSGKVCCHRFEKFDDMEDVYALMRETLEIGESLEQSVSRGLAEEWELKGKIINYLGSIASHFPGEKGNMVNKTTLYFLCQLQGSTGNQRSLDDAEGSSAIEWHTPEFLIARMAEQGKKYQRTDFDESAIIKAAFGLT